MARTYSMSAEEWRKQMAIEVQEYAAAHYAEERSGWDIVVECYDTEQIVEIIRTCRTVNGAIAKVAEHVGFAAEVRADIMATAF